MRLFSSLLLFISFYIFLDMTMTTKNNNNNNPLVLFSIIIKSTNNVVAVHRIGESGEWDQLPKTHTNSSSTSFQMTGLLPFTIYSFRVEAVNSIGTSLPSKESYYFVTLRESKYGKMCVHSD